MRVPALLINHRTDTIHPAMMSRKRGVQFIWRRDDTKKRIETGIAGENTIVRNLATLPEVNNKVPVFRKELGLLSHLFQVIARNPIVVV